MAPYNITENLEQKKNTSPTPVGQATDKKLQAQPTKMNSFKFGNKDNTGIESENKGRTKKQNKIEPPRGKTNDVVSE